MRNEYVSFSQDWWEDDKMIILFALRRVNELEEKDTITKKQYQEEQERGLFGKIKRKLS